MMSRITLNLRKSVSKAYANDKTYSDSTYVFPGASQRMSIESGHSIRFAAATHTPTVTNNVGLLSSVGPPSSYSQLPVTIPLMVIPLTNDA